MYRFESALTHVPEVTAPFLIMHGTADPTVSFTNGLGFYNALRVQQQESGPAGIPGRRAWPSRHGQSEDLTIRYFQFFNHYLKGAPAPKWLTEGIPYLEKDANRDPRSVK